MKLKKIFAILIFILLGIFVGNEIDKKISAESIEEISAGPKVLVLNYHQVANTFSPLAITPNDFSMQMAYLLENGYVSITPDELEAGLSG